MDLFELKLGNFEKFERGGNMVANLRLDSNGLKHSKQIANFFKKDVKIKYNKKLSGKVRLYVSEKNGLRNLTGVLSLYENSLN